MEKTRKKSMIFSIALASVMILTIVAFAYIQLRESGKLGSIESNNIMKEFNSYFNSKERTVIYYASPKCSVCTLQTPILETISKDYDLEYYYLDSSKLNLNQNKEVTEKLGIEASTPTTIIVENGKVIDTAVGYTPGYEYVEFFKNSDLLEDDAVYSNEKYITFINYEKYKDIIEDSEEKQIVVIGQTGCSHCISIKPALNSIAKDYNITINYLNLTTMTNDENNDFYNTLEQMEYNDEDFVNEGKFGTPLTLIIKNGKIENYISGERTISQLVREFKKLDIIKE